MPTTNAVLELRARRRSRRDGRSADTVIAKEIVRAPKLVNFVTAR